ncbi:MAG TPA: choice-of-anchor J domain-containing protein, partial [Candidatus Syntrophosphaera thermopropionivorans]|nr:choice-of-anchor J domain-containing protein [Candidatus Syntrophosphaera thermopropionivorans]
ATIYSGSTSIIVSTGISKALVSIIYNNCIYGRGYTNAAGTVSINLINAPLGNLSYTITVTAFNCVTYIGVINQIIPNVPWMTVSSVVYDDDNNDIPEYNESGFFDVTFSNVGSSSASNVSCVLSCSTAGITITNNTITIPFLAANASTIIDNAFALSIADNIANGTVANFTITMTIGGYTPWTYEFFRIISAPALQFGNITIYDPTGNNNGRLDPGETVTITIHLNNNGGSASPSGTATMSCSDSGITINNGYAVFSSIPASGNTTLSFNLTASASLTIGTLITLNFNATAGAYTVNKLEPITLGLILEDFETGNFNAFGWTMGTYPWTIDSSTYHSGNYAARSGSITHSQSSTMEIIRILSSVGTLSFWYKVSSEANYDFLKFSVDGTVQGSWSGTVDWTQASFTIPAGQHILQWAYTKDASESSGSDCAWIDDIIFPTSIAYTPPTITYSPSFFIQRLNPDQTAIQNLTIGKTGTGTLNFTVSRPSGTTTVLDESFENGGSIPSGWTQTIINGFVTWTFTTGGYNGHPASAFDGTYNARFYYGNTTSFTTKLVTPPLNLNGADIATLTFWHTQEARDGNQDQLKVYYRTSSTAPWNLITSYTNSIANWTQETINLPNLSSTYYIAFEGISHYGYGVCVDKVVVTKTLTTMIPTWITVSGGGSYSGSIAYNEPAQDIPIGFNSVGLSPSTYTTNLTIYSNDALHPSITIPITLIVSQTSLPIIVINPLAINFGTVAINSNVQEQFSIQNTGTAILSGNISTPEGYTVSDATLKDSKGTLLSGYNDYPRNTLSYSINPGSSKIYNLIFSPVSATTYSGNVVITSNDPNNPTLNIAVTGSGYIPNIPPIVTISNSAAGLVLSWNEIPHATQYQIYRSTL